MWSIQGYYFCLLANQLKVPTVNVRAHLLRKNYSRNFSSIRSMPLFGPRLDKTCLRGFRQSEIQTSLLTYRDYLENCNFACSKLRYDTFRRANNKGADQTALIRLRGCAGWSAPLLFVNHRRRVFSRRGPF